MRRSSDTQSDIVRGEVVDARVLREGWGRLTLRAGAETHVVTGTVLGFATGDAIEARGRWSDHPRFGRQFCAQTIRCTVPSDARGAIAWLSSRLPGLGKRRATALVERFGVPAVYDVIAQRPEELTAIPGVTPELAERIRAEHERVRGEAEEMTALLGWGLTDGQIRRCKEAWGKKVLEVLRADPYRLAEEVYGFGFKRSDEIARRMGLPVDHPRRLQAVCLHVLREAETEGHCYVLRGQLLRVAMDELAAAAVRVGQVAEQLDVVIDEGRLVQVEDEAGERGHARIYLPDTRAAETQIAAHVRRMLAWRGPGASAPADESEAA